MLCPFRFCFLSLIKILFSNGPNGPIYLIFRMPFYFLNIPAPRENKKTGEQGPATRVIWKKNLATGESWQQLLHAARGTGEQKKYSKNCLQETFDI